MEAAPFEEPRKHKTLFNDVQDIVLDCLAVLLEQDRFVIHAINYERITYEELGKRMGISATHAWRLKQIAYSHLEEVLMIDGRISKILRYD
jgi:DNA-directed RNA polymerase specialized sigma24 family protein